MAEPISELDQFALDRYVIANNNLDNPTYREAPGDINTYTILKKYLKDSGIELPPSELESRVSNE